MQDQELLNSNTLSMFRTGIKITTSVMILGFALAVIAVVIEEFTGTDDTINQIAGIELMNSPILLAFGMFLMGTSGLFHTLLLAKLVWLAEDANTFVNSTNKISHHILNSLISKNANWWMFRLGWPIFGILFLGAIGFIGSRGILALVFNW